MSLFPYAGQQYILVRILTIDWKKKKKNGSNRMVVTDNDVMKLETHFLFILFLESNKKSNAGLLKEMRRCLRNKSFFLFGLIFIDKNVLSHNIY